MTPAGYIVLWIIVVLVVSSFFIFGKQQEVDAAPVKVPVKPAVVTPPATVSVAKKVKKSTKKTK